MKRRRKNHRKERMIMLCSSVFVLTALTMTGIYVKERQENQDDGYVVDLSRLENDNAQNFTQDMEVNLPEEDSETVSSSKIENRESLWEKDSYFSVSGKYDFAEESEADIWEEESMDFFSKKEEELKFSEEEALLWPVVGNVLINYSMDSPVYFSTLEQYKYSPAIVIQAKEGQNIMAAARGKVTKIEKTQELGNVITMDIGNGYEISYGQLTNIQIKEGDIVEKGAYIADVSSPTKFYSIEGDNVYFALRKEGKPINPMTKLQ